MSVKKNQEERLRIKHKKSTYVIQHNIPGIKYQNWTNKPNQG